jgi:hypothetical protein
MTLATLGLVSKVYPLPSKKCRYNFNHAVDLVIYKISLGKMIKRKWVVLLHGFSVLIKYSNKCAGLYLFLQEFSFLYNHC